MGDKSTTTRKFTGKVRETKDSYVVEEKTGPNSIHMHEPGYSIDEELSHFDGKNIKVKLIIEIEEIE